MKREHAKPSLDAECRERKKALLFTLQHQCCLAVAVLLISCASSNHDQKPAAASDGLVDLRTFMPGLSIDLRYASSQNIAQHPLYPADMPCLLHRTTARKLQLAQNRLRQHGYGLRIWDAWRPTEVQLKLIAKGGATGLFLDPREEWSRHCSGVAVDVTLVDLEGREQRMPTGHDDASDNAYYQYSGADPEIRQNLERLQNAMTEAGFVSLAREWWHFNDLQWRLHPPPPVSAEQMGIPLPNDP